MPTLKVRGEHYRIYLGLPGVLTARKNAAMCLDTMQYGKGHDKAGTKEVGAATLVRRPTRFGNLESPSGNSIET